MKLGIFDFDDTLCNTDSKVIIRKENGDVLTLSSEEFAVHKVEEGDFVDFKEFNKVVKPSVRKHRIVLERMLWSNTNVVICTARHIGARKAIREWLVEEFGRKAYQIDIVCLGDSTPEAKANVAIEYVENYHREFSKHLKEVYFCDDSWKNVRAVGDALDNYDIKMKLQKV